MTIDFKHIQELIVGSFEESESWHFIMYADTFPKEGDAVVKYGKEYEVYSVTDVTTDEEREEGLSYNRVDLVLKERKKKL